LANFLTALDPFLATETVDELLLGLSSTATSEAVSSLFASWGASRAEVHPAAGYGTDLTKRVP
jgi:hypothetical protein